MGGKVLNYRAKDILNQGIEQGIVQGSDKTRNEVAENMFRLGKYSLKEIAQCTNMSVQDVEALAEKLGVLSPA